MGVYLSPLACERNEVRPKRSGGRFDFISSVDPSANRTNRPDDSHFVQFGAEGSVAGWRYDGVATLDATTWRLDLVGRLSSSTTITFDDLVAAAADGRDLTVLNTLRCIIDSTGIPGLVGTALWRGVPLARFLETAGVLPDVRRFRFFARDGFTNNLRREEVLDAEAPERSPLLAFAVNGQDVPHIHGGPVRLLVPGKYGFKSLKWVDRIEATTDDRVFGSYQEAFGFDDDGTIQLATKVTDPLAEAMIPAGPAQFFGYAIGGQAPVHRVEVAIDDQPFQAAQLDSLSTVLDSNPEIADAIQVQVGRAYPFAGVWTLFRFDWTATPGPHRLRFRATDAAGNVQPPIDEDVSNGADGYWDIRVRVTTTV